MTKPCITPQAFKMMREKLGYSQRGLAAAWDMSPSSVRTVGRWERGEMPLSPLAAHLMRATVQGYKPEDK